MKDKSFEALKENVIKDINECNTRQLNKIYKSLRKVLFQFDRDTIWKNVKDFFKSVRKGKKEKCIFFIDDICDSSEKLTANEKEELRKQFLDISNIHRTFLEDLQALLNAL